jgi:asparagine synthase (glutamine-hydrolysing)
MCGISALFSPFLNNKPDRELLRRLNDAQFHRGPDEGAVYVEPHVGLGHRRLSIIDIATGQQPLFNEDSSVAVVFNGEIYNFSSVRRELELAGHRFSTNSDTEIIVHGWEQWGADCVHRFRGMFAFILWDRSHNTLFVARDRLGVKPLHYAQLPNGSWVFGSELKVVTAHPDFVSEIDTNAVEDFLALGYIPDPRTIWQGASKLPPAHYMIFRVGEENPTIERYWDVPFAPDNRITEAEAAEQFRDLFDDAVKMRMIAEVPLGAFLSGGVDSSAVVASMARQSNSPVRTCSISFDNPKFDESKFALRVAQQYSTDHQTDRVSENDFDLLDKLVDLYDEPYADSSAIPTYRLCQVARKRVTVALSGDGGDETFGGYRRYRMHLAEDRIRQTIPLSMRKSVFRSLGEIYPKFDRLPRVFRAKTTFQALAQDSASAYYNSVSVIRSEVRERLYSDEFKRKLNGYRTSELFSAIAATAPTDDSLSIIQYLDYQTYLPGDINTKVDRASMAHSLEVREPLMDHVLVEWAGRLSPKMKIRNNEGKFIFKKAMESRLPHEILYRKKMGFAIPLAEWFRGPLATRLRQVGSSKILESCGVFNMHQVGILINEHIKGDFDHSRALWSIVIFEGFLRKQAHS